MNELREAIWRCGLTELEALNVLQGSGIISDNVVALRDIPLSDLPRAKAWLLIKFGVRLTEGFHHAGRL